MKKEEEEEGEKRRRKRGNKEEEEKKKGRRGCNAGRGKSKAVEKGTGRTSHWPALPSLS